MSARNNVVLPDPVPPAITMLRLALTAAAKKSWSVSSKSPRSRNWFNDEISKRCLRITRLGRADTSIVANSREPSGSCRLSSGVAASNRLSVRPIREAARRMSSINSSSESTTGETFSRSPFRSFTHTGAQPRTWISLISGSSNNDCNLPSPSTCAMAALASCRSCKSENGARPSWRREVPSLAHSACAALRAKSHSCATTRSALPFARRKIRSSASASLTRDASAETKFESSGTSSVSLPSCKMVMVGRPRQHLLVRQHALCQHQR